MRHEREKVEGYGGTRVRHGIVFDDPLELLDMVCPAGEAGSFAYYLGPNEYVFGGKSRGGRDREKLSWLGRDDLTCWADVRAAVTTVWESGEKRVRRMLDKLASHPFAPPRDLRRRSRWREDDGADFDVDRFCEGKPAWRGPERRETIGRQFLTFVVDVAANCDTTAESLYWRAVVAIATATVLEQFGYGVEVIACANFAQALHPPGRRKAECEADDFRHYGYNHLHRDLAEYDRQMRRYQHVVITPGQYQDVFAAVWVKRPDDPVDMGMLTGVCAPWFFRLALFGLCGLVPDSRTRTGIGHIVQVEPAKLDSLIGPAQGDRVILENVWNESAAVRLMRDTLKRYADPEWLADNPAELDKGERA